MEFNKQYNIFPFIYVPTLKFFNDNIFCFLFKKKQITVF